MLHSLSPWENHRGVLWSFRQKCFDEKCKSHVKNCVAFIPEIKFEKKLTEFAANNSDI
jgi:hypothetical protein